VAESSPQPDLARRVAELERRMDEADKARTEDERTIHTLRNLLMRHPKAPEPTKE